MEQRATTLRTAFHRSPQLLQAAMDYYHVLGADNPDLDGQLRAVRSHALQLGGLAKGEQRYTLAAEYYDVAGDEAKVDAMRALHDARALQEMQPSIDAAREQADALIERFGDPAQVEAMRRQAEAVPRNLEQAASAQSRRESTDELARELGL